jgi:hypothetical protein
VQSWKLSITQLIWFRFQSPGNAKLRGHTQGPWVIHSGLVARPCGQESRPNHLHSVSVFHLQCRSSIKLASSSGARDQGLPLLVPLTSVITQDGRVYGDV